jgi:hypothetical protein
LDQGFKLDYIGSDVSCILISDIGDLNDILVDEVMAFAFVYGLKERPDLFYTRGLYDKEIWFRRCILREDYIGLCIVGLPITVFLIPCLEVC